LLAGSIDRDSAGYLGILGEPGGSGLAATPGKTEGISCGVTSLPRANQETQVKLDAIIVRWMGAGESVTVVNRLTRNATTFQGSGKTYPEVTLDISALGIVAKAGQTENIGVIFPGSNSSIRIAGVDLELTGADRNPIKQADCSSIHFSQDDLHSK
jgi:hypothetical protein